MKYLIWINSEGKPNVAKNESSNITIIINIILLIENVEKNVIIVFNSHYREFENMETSWNHRIVNFEKWKSSI